MTDLITEARELCAIDIEKQPIHAEVIIEELCDVLEKAQAVMWIPITERLPEQHVDVLVCGTKAINNVKYLCAVKCLDGNVFRPLSAPSVTWTHWMPLPAPPEEGTEK